VNGGRYAPRVSIGLPVFNGQRYLRQTLDSVLAQTYEGFELIISDNDSTDATDAICREYADRDERVRYFRNPKNLGAAANFNRVFQLSTREYFKWLAADDLMEPRFLETCLEALDTHPKAVIAYPRIKPIDLNGNVFPDFRPGPHTRWAPDPAGRLRQILDSAPWVIIYVFGLIRSEALERARPLGKHLGADCNLLAELALMGQLHEVPEHLSLIRVHPGSSTWPGWKNAQRQQFFDPSNNGRLSPAIFQNRRYFEYFVSILRSELPAREKLSLVSHNALRPLRRLSARRSRDRASGETARKKAA
jgi:glycosyltransferase involved in cell wall biosynthesis